MSRYKASSIHLLISAILVGNVIGIVYWVWYPQPTLEVVGAAPIILLLVVVDLIVGPLLTLIIYKHGKPGLKFDLAVIGVIQVMALIYGSYRLYEEKPDYLVFVVDRLEFVARKQVDVTEIDFDTSKDEKFANLVPVVARIPEDPEAYQAYFDSIVLEGKADIDTRPEFWEPWSSGADLIRHRIKALTDIKPASPAEEKAVEQAISKFASDHPNLGVLPIGGIERDIGMLMDRDTLQILGVLDANPWVTDDS